MNFCYYKFVDTFRFWLKSKLRKAVFSVGYKLTPNEVDLIITVEYGVF
jgi:hypothetical protein